jgi:hypothetical protein
MNRFDPLHLDDYEVLDHEIHPVAQFDFLAIVNDRQADLAGRVKPAFSQFMLKAHLVCAFQQSRPQQRVDAHRPRNDRVSDLIDAKVANRSSSSLSNCITQCCGFPL